MMSRKILSILCIILCCATSAPTPKRIALVIGNSNYENSVPLPNAVRDAERVAERLDRLGFEVMPSTTDLDRTEFHSVFEHFINKINSSGPNPIVFVYYAGHAAQDEFGINYFIPIDSSAETPEEVRLSGVPLQSLLGSMAEEKNSINILVIDACRDWFENSRLPDYPKGLRDMGVQSSVLIAYATRSGQTAEETPDSTGSVYSKRLVEALDKYYSDPVALLFNDITSRVEADTEGSQVPEYVNGLTRSGRWSFSSKDINSTPETPKPVKFYGHLSNFLEDLDRERLLNFARRKTSFVDTLLDRRDILEKYKINTEKHLSYFLAIVAFESSGFKQKQEELFRYSPTALLRLFPSRVQTLSDAESLVLAGPEAIANTVYGSRLGNGAPESGDGWRFRGRGIFFITGRYNYRVVGKEIGVDLESAPDLVSDNEIGLAIAAAFWRRQKMNDAADLDDMHLAVRRFNGSLAASNADLVKARVKWLASAQKAVGKYEVPSISAADH
jgi:putative chitinase